MRTVAKGLACPSAGSGPATYRDAATVGARERNGARDPSLKSNPSALRSVRDGIASTAGRRAGRQAVCAVSECELKTSSHRAVPLVEFSHVDNCNPVVVEPVPVCTMKAGMKARLVTCTVAVSKQTSASAPAVDRFT